MLKCKKLQFEWYHTQNIYNLFYSFHSVCDNLFVYLFVPFWCVFDVKITRFLNRYCCIHLLIENNWLKLWAEIFDMFNFIKFWFEWYQNHAIDNLFDCLRVIGKVTLFFCLFILYLYLTSKTQNFADVFAFKHWLWNPLKR